MRRNGPNLFTHLPQAGNRTLPQYAPEGTAEDANNCTIVRRLCTHHRRPVARDNLRPRGCFPAGVCRYRSVDRRHFMEASLERPSIFFSTSPTLKSS